MKALITNEFIRKGAEKTGEILELLCRKTEEMNIVRIVLCQGFLLLGCITFSSSFYGTEKIFQAESAVRGLSFLVLCLAFFGGSDLLRKAGALIHLLGTLLLIGERLVYWQGNYEIVNGLIEYHWMSGPDVFLLYFLAKTMPYIHRVIFAFGLYENRDWCCSLASVALLGQILLNVQLRVYRGEMIYSVLSINTLLTAALYYLTSLQMGEERKNEGVIENGE